MAVHGVAITKYKKGESSVGQAITLSNAFQNMPSNARVVIKPNIVCWLRGPFPKWGVITTARVVEETVIALREHGAGEIAIVEGLMRSDPKDKELAQLAFKHLGYDKLKDRYDIKAYDSFERPFSKTDLGDGVELSVNNDIMDCDFVVNIPVMKTHAQTAVSLGMKNLKGVLNMNSRKKCHSPDMEKDLEYMISHLPGLLPPSATILDGIYTIERGPAFDGKARRSDLIVASADLLSADMVGTKLLGHKPEDIGHIRNAAKRQGRPLDLSDIDVKGEKIDDVASFHEYTFPYNEDNTLPVKMAKMGMTGLKYYKYDSSLCTYCSGLNGMLLTILGMTWNGKPFDDVEFLTGKRMTPTPGMKKTILVGQCMCKLNKDYQGPQELIPIKGCPPDPKDAIEAMKKIGISIDETIFKNQDMGGAYFMARYKGKPEFDESFFTIE